jgi:glycyl-tRNA synthetase
VDRFTVSVIQDDHTGEVFELKHLIKAHLNKANANKKTTAEIQSECEDMVRKMDNMDEYEMSDFFRQFDMKSPISDRDLSDPSEWDLLCHASIFEETGMVPGFLRPELAQGIFVNFKRLLEFNEVIILTKKFLFHV